MENSLIGILHRHRLNNGYKLGYHEGYGATERQYASEKLQGGVEQTNLAQINGERQRTRAASSREIWRQAACPGSALFVLGLVLGLVLRRH